LKFTFNTEKPLKDLPGLVEASMCVKEVVIRPCEQNVPLRTPVTPVTPVTAEAFVSLQKMTCDYDARSLEPLHKQKLERQSTSLPKPHRLRSLGVPYRKNR
jgi:hypothetical protein